MRRFRISLLVAALPVTLIAATSCGVTADTTAATVAGQTITVDSVDAIARENIPAGDPSVDNGSVLSGDLVRSVLAFQIQGEAAVGEAARWGLTIDDSVRAEAVSQLQKQQVLAQGKPETRQAQVEYTAAQLVLNARFATLDPQNSSDLRLLYDGLPTYWSRVCISGLALPVAKSAAVAKLLERGTEFSDVPAKVSDAQLVGGSADSCYPLSALPTELRDAIEVAPVGDITDAVSVTDPTAGVVVYYLRVDDRRTVSLTDAQPELASLISALAKKGSVALTSLVVQGAKINPRYGSGVATQLDSNNNPQTSVLAPPVPVQPKGLPVIATPTAAATGTDTGQ